MKNIFSKMMVIAAMLFAGSALMTACTPDNGDDYNGPPVLEVGKPNVISAARVEIPLNAKKLQNLIYKVDVVGVDEEFVSSVPTTAKAILRGGKKVAGNLKVLKLTGNDGLDRNKKVRVHIGGIVSDTEFYGEDPLSGDVFSVEFTTPNYYADEDVYIIRTTSEGADIAIQFPEVLKQRGHRIKWGIASYAMLEYYGQKPMPMKLNQNDFMFPAFIIQRDTVLNINHKNAFRLNDKGEMGYYYFAGYRENGNVIIAEADPNDPKVESGEAAPVEYYQIFQPGEPLVLMMSEVAYADCPEIKNLEGDPYIDHVTNGKCPYVHPMVDWSWGPGWYWYPYDYAAYLLDGGGEREPGELPMPGVGGGSDSTIDFDKYWLDGAWWKRIEIRLPGPSKFETGSVTINTSGLKTDGGRITFTPTGDTYAFLATIVPQTSSIGAGYTDLLKFVNNDPSLLQWLTTSQVAPYLSIYPYYETTVMNLEEILYEVEAGMTYHVIVNAVPGKMENGDMTLDVSKQSFQHITFKLPEYTIDEPELIVTPYEAYSPYKVKFNVKNANPSIPVKKVVYAANETREFSSYMDMYGYNYGDIVMANDGYANLSTAEIAEVNSEFGYDMEFDVTPNTFLTLAVMGWNNEGRPSDPDKEGSKAVAEARSTDVEEVEQLDMTKLNALKGDWTATATVKTYDYETGNISSAQKSWKVTIGDLTTNNTLSADDYAVFEEAGVTKEATDAYLAEFNELAANYNASVLAQNRVLCQGWDLSGTRETAMTSPWDLFRMKDYSASLTDYLFNDFGPKWFLQTDADGNIFVPVNYNVVPNMMCWFNGLDHYLCSGNFEEGIANYYNKNDKYDVQGVGIPVEISEDGNTVTLKAVTVTIASEDKEGDEDKEGNEAKEGDEDKKDKNITLYPTMIYDNQGQLAFYNQYVMSEVVLTKGWNGTTTEPAPAPAPAKASSKKVANGKHFTSPAKTFSRTLFAPTTKKVSEKNANVVTKKLPTKEEMRQGLDKYMQRFNFGAARK